SRERSAIYLPSGTETGADGGSLGPMRPHPVVSSCAPRSRISNALAPVLVASYGCGHLDAQISRRRHQSLPLEVGLALLEESLDAFARILGLGDEQVAGARQTEASGEGVAVDASNYRLSQLGHQDKQVDEEVAAAIALEAGHLAVEAAEVGSGAEHASGSGQDHDADVGLVAAPGKR